ncbi:MAG: hypothetical protein K6E98_05110 [Lachnospiraceae bacterium]|nr:hypothetical protein [Lachnospiraceae bacterium]
MKIMGKLMQFQQAHPKFARFVMDNIRSGITEGSVLELTITRPGGEPMTTNMRVTQEDIELLKSFKGPMG